MCVLIDDMHEQGLGQVAGEWKTKQIVPAIQEYLLEIEVIILSFFSFFFLKTNKSTEAFPQNLLLVCLWNAKDDLVLLLYSLKSFWETNAVLVYTSS